MNTYTEPDSPIGMQTLVNYMTTSIPGLGGRELDNIISQANTIIDKQSSLKTHFLEIGKILGMGDDGRVVYQNRGEFGSFVVAPYYAVHAILSAEAKTHDQQDCPQGQAAPIDFNDRDSVSYATRLLRDLEALKNDTVKK
ncbi:hypothetical protein ACFL0V_01970 [Nanoarchaeota archaeon]